MNKVRTAVLGCFMAGLLMLSSTPVFANPIIEDETDYGFLFILIGAAIVIAVVITIVVMIIRKTRKK